MTAWPIRIWRINLGLNKAQMSRKLGVSYDHYRNMEDGASKLPDKVKKLAAFEGWELSED